MAERPIVKLIDWLPLAIALIAPASSSAQDGSASDLGVLERAHSAPVSLGPMTPAETKLPTSPGRTLSPNPLWEIPLKSLSSTRERPIFTPSRRPPPPAVAAPVLQDRSPPPKPPRIERPELSLVGTVAGEEQSIGIFIEQTTKAPLRLKIGEDYKGWKLRGVRAREVTLERDARAEILTLPHPGEGSSDSESRQVENVAQRPLAAPDMTETSRPNLAGPPNAPQRRRIDR